MPKEPILYVEDEETDVLMLQFALKRARVHNPLIAVNNGEEALAYLSGILKYTDRTEHPLPGLILLDLNIPRISGIQVLQWIREQPQFAALPVVIFTSAAHPDEIEKVRGLGATDYIVKPSGMDSIISMVQRVKERWLGHS